MKLGRVFREWRTAMNLSLSAAAASLRIPKPTLGRFERTGRADASTLSKILRWLLEEE